MARNKAIIEFPLSDDLVSLNESCYPKIKGEVLKLAINPYKYTGIITFSCDGVTKQTIREAIEALQLYL